MRIVASRSCRATFAAIVLVATWLFVGQRSGAAVEVGEPAPDFTLASTSGNDISLSDFRGKKWVLLEFYGQDFVPT